MCGEVRAVLLMNVHADTIVYVVTHSSFVDTIFCRPVVAFFVSQHQYRYLFSARIFVVRQNEEARWEGQCYVHVMVEVKCLEMRFKTGNVLPWRWSPSIWRTDNKSSLEECRVHIGENLVTEARVLEWLALDSAVGETWTCDLQFQMQRSNQGFLSWLTRVLICSHIGFFCYSSEITHQKKTTKLATGSVASCK